MIAGSPGHYQSRHYTYLQCRSGELQACMRFFTCKQVVHIHFPPLHIPKHDDAPWQQEEEEEEEKEEEEGLLCLWYLAEHQEK